MLIYKIHPAIGIGRVGDSPDKFFVGPETPSHPGFEIQDDGTETSIADGKYKDAGRIKRQAARFRIFEYDQDAAGVQTLNREITANDAKITWKVDLVNSKAALDRTPPHKWHRPPSCRPPTQPHDSGSRPRRACHPRPAQPDHLRHEPIRG
jgi:hypothetical protein